MSIQYSRSEIFNFVKVESGCTTLVLADKRQKRNNEFAFWPLYTVQYVCKKENVVCNFQNVFTTL